MLLLLPYVEPPHDEKRREVHLWFPLAYFSSKLPFLCSRMSLTASLHSGPVVLVSTSCSLTLAAEEGSLLILSPHQNRVLYPKPWRGSRNRSGLEGGVWERERRLFQECCSTWWQRMSQTPGRRHPAIPSFGTHQPQEWPAFVLESRSGYGEI